MQRRHALAVQLVAFGTLFALGEISGGCSSSDTAPTGPVASANDTTTGTTSSATHGSTTAVASSASGGGASSSGDAVSSVTHASVGTTASSVATASSTQAASTSAQVASSTSTSAASSGAGGCAAAYAHTITIDGTNDFSASETFTTTSSPSYTGYLTWDATNVYVGMTGPDIDSGDGNKWVQMYIGGTGGTQSGLTYDTQHATLPFPAKWHVRWKADNTYTNAEVWDGASWSDAGWSFSGLIFKSGNYLEMAIPRSNIGSPTSLQIHVAMVNETSLAEGTYAGVPSTSFIDGYNPTYAHYFAFDLSACATPLSYSPL